MKVLVPPKFRVLRDETRCIGIGYQVCINQCSYYTHYYYKEKFTKLFPKYLRLYGQLYTY
jgi:Fe-S-cluster-containing dehydrogenase component